MRARPLLMLVAAFLLVPLAEDAAAQDHHHPEEGEVVGSVSFATSCNAEAQGQFDRAVAMLHSFWFERAHEAFVEAAEMDPGCAMPWWGQAMTLWGNSMTRAAPSPERQRTAQAAIAEARRRAAGATAREVAWIEAAAALYDDADEKSHIERMRAHEAAMRDVMETYPDDTEAAVFYGRIVIGNAPPDDLTFSRQLHAAEILEPLFERQPDHPGLAHYLIHAYDAPATAEQGVEAARRYADIAPAAPHALHMPSHIFTRLGYWHESIEMNARSAQAEPDPDAAVHPLDYMVYAFLQLGRDDDARGVLARARTASDAYYGGLLGYNFAAMQARFALERDRWEETVSLPLPDNAEPYVQAIPRFARALGAARSGDPAGARPELEAMVELTETLERAGDAYWATVVEAQRLAAAAWVSLAEGDEAGALALAGRAAELESTVEKHPVTPGPLIPARELEGDLFMELGRPGEALVAYERTLEKEPKRARALFGAARAAELSDQEGRARAHYEALLELMAEADPDRPARLAAREYLSRH
jgi:tetratricopeptide (TPR) repeat protein